MPDRPPTQSPTFRPVGAPNTDKERPGSRPPSAPKPVHPSEKTRDFFQATPKLEIPKGGGALRGIGEKFEVNAATGTASLSVPIPVSPSRQGFQPALSLSYNSGSGNGVFGLGWSLGLPQVQRKTDRGLPEYQDAIDSDTFVLSDSEDLLPAREWDSDSSTWIAPALADANDGTSTWSRRRYRPRVDSAAACIERWTETTSGEVHWRTWSRENVCRIYGLSSAARLANPDDATRVFAWYLEEERDERGNRIKYEYAAENRLGAPATPAEAMRDRAGHASAYVYLKRIYYGNLTPFVDDGDWLFEIVLDYGEHPGDATTTPPVPPSHTEDSLSPWQTRLDIFSSFRARFDVRCYRLCQRVLVYHRFDDPSGGDEPTLVRSTEFSYAPSAVATTLSSITARGWRYDDATSAWTTAALPALALTYVGATTDATVRLVEGLEDLPSGLDTALWRWADLDGDGMAGLLTEQGAGWFFKRNNGAGALAPARAITARPLPGAIGGLADLDGDGRSELVVHRPGLHGYAARDDAGDWLAFRRFRQVPNIDWDSPNLRQLDLDGDGLPDVLLTESDCLTWYPSEGREGWAEARRSWRARDEDEGPRILFSSDREAIFLADMSGDGLTDLVRVRVGCVEYWPNRGMGHFGARVVMANSPTLDRSDRFDPKRVRFADIDGSGPADLLYIGPQRVRMWQNRCGNSFDSREGTELPIFPGVDNAASVQVADLLGDGTACLVWSSPLARDAWCPLRFVHLMAEGKPYLLRTITNNLGRVTTLTYAPSTQFMVADREAGTPWATRLPFPVQCLESVAVRDEVTGWGNTSVYAYHHGYFDSAEREFRGFGKVEQWDTERLGTYSSASRGTGAEQTLDPIRTVSWFHTGAWLQEGRLEAAYATEYWAEDAVDWPTENATADAPVSGAVWPDWTASERREATRALRGRLLRQEVYAEDGVSDAPYAVTATTWTAARLQPKGDGEHASFVAVARESLVRHYERIADDPRAAHELTLRYNQYGDITQKAMVGYPRRDGADRRDDQNKLQVTVIESALIQDTSGIVDEADPDQMHWHVGVPHRTTTWHLTQSSWLDGGGQWIFTDEALFDVDTLDAELSGATEIPFEQAASTGAEKRALAIEAKLYWADDLSGPATAGAMERRALPYQVYRKALTAGLASATYADLPSSTDFEDAGYIDLDGDGDLWVASGTVTLDPDLFYQPTTLTDPFGNDTDLVYDEWALFVLTATDALGNASTVAIDQVALQPSSVEDINNNLSYASYDALGRLVATAVQGKSSESLGDDLSAPTVAYTYELDRWAMSSLAARVIVTSRTEHGGSEVLTRTTYSDGGGNVVQEKVSAEPGTVGTSYASTRWVGSGRRVLNNKGLPVKQYEPYFSATDECEFEDEVASAGVSSTVFYDPAGRVTRVALPNGCLRKVAFSPWQQSFSDENDTSADADCTADSALVARAADHAGTPTTVYLDHLGRPVATDELPDNTSAPYTTTLTLDVVGNPVNVEDGRGNDIQAQSFDMLGRPLYTDSTDSGYTCIFFDSTSQPLRIWKDGDLLVEYGYDALRRRATVLVTEGSATPRLVEVNEYGESQGSTLNHKGRLYRQWDTAGRIVNDSYDFEGNLVSTTRRFWDWATNGEEVTWGDDAADTPSDSLLEFEEFTISLEYDALHRVATQTTPDNSVTRFTYNEASLLEAVEADVRGDTTPTEFVTDIDYNARGQRASIAYGNDVTTEYSYEVETFRLSTLTTTHNTLGTTYQHLEFTYDPVGNVVSIEDTADVDNNAGLSTTLYFNNGAVSPNQSFAYDALYRLIEATGREKTSLAYVDPGDEPAFGNRPDLNTAVQSYTQSYEYDEVGNIIEMSHFVGSGSAYNWIRTYTYASGNNQLDSTTVGSVTENFAHDARGSITYLPNLKFSSSLSANVVTDFRDQVRKVFLAGSGHYALYFYDASGQRVRKVVMNGTHKERIYIGGTWERWREYDGSGNVDEERETLHIQDGAQRVAMVETLTVTGGSAVGTPSPVLRYQLGNHLGTAAVELDYAGGVISYEEYHPYGTTSWRAPSLSTVSQKRYKYTGMERDEESGLQCHGLRYYVAWLGRWLTADPIGLGAGPNCYRYAHDAPTSRIDPSGLIDPEVAAPVFSWENVGQITDALLADPKAIASRIVDHPLDSFMAGMEAMGVNGDASPIFSIEDAMTVGHMVVGLADAVAEVPSYIPDTAVNSYMLITGTPSEKLAAVRDQRENSMQVATVGLIVIPELAGGTGAAEAGVLRAGTVEAGTVEAGAVDVSTSTATRGIVKPSSPPAAAVKPGGTGQALVGHGNEIGLAGETTIPEGTTFRTYCRAGESMPDAMGQLIEEGRYADAQAQFPGVYEETIYPPGSQAPNLLLSPADAQIEAFSNSMTVDTPLTPLEEILQPNMGCVDWASCRLPR